MPLVHGRASTYTNAGCRCIDCKRAARERSDQYRKERVQAAKEVIEEHGAICDACGSEDKDKYVVDYSVRRTVRGVLCLDCRTIIGRAGEDANALEGMASYIRRRDLTPF